MSARERLQIVVDVNGAGKGATEIKRVIAAEKQLAGATKQVNAATREMAGRYRDANGRLREANGQFVKTGASANTAARGIRNSSRAAKEADSSYSGMNARLRASNSGMASLSGGLLLGAGRLGMLRTGAVGAGIALGAAAVTGAKFEQVMDRVSAVSQASEQDMAKLTKQAMHLGATTQFSAKDAADGMYQLATAGFSAQQVMKTIPGTLDLAAASGTDLASAAAIQATAIRGFGLEAKDATRVADVMTQVVNSSAVEMADLGETIAYIAPVAKATGQSIEDMMAAVAIMGNVGIKGSMAGTTLRTALVRLTAPTKKSRDALADLGITAEALRGPKGLKPIPEIMQKIADGAGKVDKGTRNAALAQIFGREALSGMIALVEKGPAAFERQIKALEKSEGAAKRAADTMRDNVAGAWDNFTGSVETAAISLSQKFQPALKDALNIGAGGINALSKGFDDIFAGASGKGGPVPAAGPVQPMPKGVAGPPAPVMAPDPNKTRQTFTELRGMATQFYNDNRQTFESLGQTVSKVWNSIRSNASEAWGEISRIWADAGPDIKNIASGFLKIGAVVADVFGDLFTRNLGNVADVFTGIARVARGFVKVLSGIFSGDIGKVWDGLKDIFSGGLKALWGLFKAATSPFRKIASKVFGGIASVAEGIWKGVLGSAQSFVNAIIKVINALPFGKDIKPVNFSKAPQSKTESGASGEMAGGGYLKGKGNRDTIPIMAAPGEAVLNRHQQGPVDAALREKYGYGLSGLFQRVQTPHYMASGGIVGGALRAVAGGAKSLIGKLPKPSALGAEGVFGDVMSSMTRGIIGKAKDYITDKFPSFGGGGGGGGGSANGLVAQVLAAIAFARKHGWRGSITSGFRSRDKQAQLYAMYLNGTGNLAAPPGNSSHETGQAIDVSDPEGFARAMSMAPAGIRLQRLVPGEPWHFSVSGHALGGFVEAARGFMGSNTLAAAKKKKSKKGKRKVKPMKKMSGFEPALSMLDKKQQSIDELSETYSLTERSYGDDLDPGEIASLVGIKEQIDTIYKSIWDKESGTGVLARAVKSKEDAIAKQLKANNQRIAKRNEYAKKLNGAKSKRMRDHWREKLRDVNAKIESGTQRGNELTGRLAELKGEQTNVENARWSTQMDIADLKGERGPAQPADNSNIAQEIKSLLLRTQGISAAQRAVFDNFANNYVGSFAKGGPIDRTGMALVHQGEFVVPRQGAAVVNSAGAAPNIVINLQGTDISGNVQVNGKTVQTIDRQMGRQSRIIETAPGRV